MLHNSVKQISEFAKTLRIEGRAFIDGEYCQAQNQKTLPCISPIDGSILQQVSECGPPDIERAIEAAYLAFQKGTWSQVIPSKRKNILLKWAALIEQHQTEIILLESLDTGKPLTDVEQIDFPLALECLRWFAELVDKLNDECIPVEAPYFATVTREPVGVVAAIIPWNYPLLITMWKVAPALASGNSVILKPSEKAPLTAIRIAGLGKDAGIPDGIFQVLPGEGKTGAYLSNHNLIDCVSFTGSTAVGKRIMQASGQSNLKRVWLELGGKSPQIILADCGNLKAVASSIAAAMFTNAGQMCDAGSRVIIDRRIKHIFIKYLLQCAEAFKPGHPFNKKTKMGPLIDQQHMQQVLKDINIAKQESKLLLGGNQVLLETGGFYIEPTIFDCDHHSLKHTQKEIFGPVLSIIAFDNLQEAIYIANDTEFGLSAGLWTSSLEHTYHIPKQLRVGTVSVNCDEGPSNMNFPFGGIKQSGNGRDKSVHAFYKYTELKTTIINMG